MTFTSSDRTPISGSPYHGTFSSTQTTWLLWSNWCHPGQVEYTIQIGSRMAGPFSASTPPCVDPKKPSTVAETTQHP